MTPEIHWPAIAARLALTVIAGILLGAERSRSGHAAGLRTTLLVMLAASVSMIQMNLLMETNGKPQNSFAVMDLMRLPLGILTGVGFIGAGVILHKNELVIGVTTAATLWYATVVGLCLGGGQVILGSTAAVIGFLVLWGLRWFESQVELFQLAELKLTISEDHLTAHELRQRLKAARFRIKTLSVTHFAKEHMNKFECEVRWPSQKQNPEVPGIVSELEELPGLAQIEWKGFGTGTN